MYYYISDPPTNKSQAAIINTIRSQLTPEGISGEFTIRAHGEPVAHLAETAIKQGFSTIVALGGDQLINELAGVLYDQHAALGVIPLEASPAITRILGYTNWRTAIQALRHRKLSLQDIGVVNSEYFFIDHLEVRAPKKTK